MKIAIHQIVINDKTFIFDESVCHLYKYFTIYTDIYIYIYICIYIYIIYALNLFIEHSGEHWWEQNIFCSFTIPQAFWQSSAPGALSTLVISVGLYSLTRATLMSPGKDETRVWGYIYIYIYISTFIYLYIIYSLFKVDLHITLPN